MNSWIEKSSNKCKEYHIIKIYSLYRYALKNTKASKKCTCEWKSLEVTKEAQKTGESGKGWLLPSYFILFIQWLSWDDSEFIVGTVHITFARVDERGCPKCS